MASPVGVETVRRGAWAGAGPGAHGADVAAVAAVQVRPWLPGDERLVAAAEPLISPTSFYQRFFTGGHRFPPRYLDRLPRGIVAIATAGGEAVGWAEIARHDDPAYAGDLGVLVVDAWQHRRIGPLLMRTVLDLARRRGISVLHADVMESNLAARRALERAFGARLDVSRDGDDLHFLLPLVPATAPDPDWSTP